jgi:rhodanese-related sulfurtransferase
MAIERVTPKEAHRRVGESDFKLLDVRSVREFEAGHPDGAINIPLLDFAPDSGSMSENPDFLRAVVATFPSDTRLVTVCAAGRRSLIAANQMESAGFGEVIDMVGGFGGNRMNPAGEPGWVRESLPVSIAAADGNTWASIKAALG